MDTRDLVLKSSSQVWNYLYEKGGLKINSFDKEIINDISKNLNWGDDLNLDKEQFAKKLSIENVSIEDFMGKVTKNN